ncbi:MAG TPA: helicase-associated domain-containing protein [Treponemataceae bacterium]|nr:helicase-associated domain-containing protein [Treponemataceae bacterium]
MRTEDVVAWREALVRLSDQHFFDLMRTYLGSIKTPFNKQRLIEELSALVRRTDTKERIVASLDALDLLILTAVRTLPDPTRDKLIQLFSGTHPFPELYERVLNLEERLLLYRGPDSEGRRYAINPLLADAIDQYIEPSLLYPGEEAGAAVRAAPAVDDLALAGIYSFFLHRAEGVRNDGSFKKKTVDALTQSFPRLAADAEAIPVLLRSLESLGLLTTQGGRVAPDHARWESFARSSVVERMAYLVAASGGRLPRDVLQARAQAVLDLLGLLDPMKAYRPEILARLSFLVDEAASPKGAGRPHGRFAAILRERAAQSATQRSAPGTAPGAGGTAEQNGDDAESAVARGPRVDIVRAACLFGALVPADRLWRRNDLSSGAAPGGFLVEATFAVTVLPGIPLAELLPLARALSLVDVQLAARYELSRASASRAFDRGMDADALVALLERASGKPLPQGVSFSLHEWHRSYAAVTLYRGFVLQAEGSRRVAIERSEHLAPRIRKVLAPGLYLVSAESEEDLRDALSRSGVDCSLYQDGDAGSEASISLPPLRAPEEEARQAKSGRFSVNPEAAERIRAALVAALDAADMSDEAREALRSRVDRRVAILPTQLDPLSVRPEKLEARGMDFLGKVRIAEYAVLTASLLEIVLDEKEGQRRVLGRPVSTDKRSGDATVKLVVEPDQRVEEVSLGRATLVRRIRGSIFAEGGPGS